MNEQTMGQRIAARRKLLNLSQEALSEKLNVSRQAISKWEADATIPEIDKLIALSKLYGVSVGWLLGVETQENPFSEELSESQLKTVEEIIKGYHATGKKHYFLRAIALLLCMAATVAVLLNHAQQQNQQLAAENAAIQAQIAELAAGNADVQAQIDKVSALISIQSESNKLLRSFVPLCYLNDDLTTVDITFYFFPRVYHENMTASLNILNPSTGFSEILECRWVGDRYLVHTTLPLANHYRYSFLLFSQSGYKEEILDGDYYYSDLLAHSSFYIDEENPKYAQMLTGQSGTISADEKTYCFNSPIYMPRVQENNGFVPFDDVTIALLHNGEVIWEADYSDAFLELYKKENIAIPLEPDIQAELPQLTEGDKLTLELSATTHTERTVITRLDDLTVIIP